MKNTSICLLLSLLILSCHAGPKKKLYAKLPEGNFVLESYFAEGRIIHPENFISAIKLDAKKKQISFLFDCNQWHGNYQSAGGKKLKLMKARSSHTDCDNPAEINILNLIPLIDGFQYNGNEVSFYQNNQLLMSLGLKNSKSVSRTVPAIGGAYQLLSMHDSRKPTTGNYNKTSINIDTKLKRIDCNVGCNSIGGEFVIDGSKIRPLRLAMTEMYCEGISDNLERQFVDNLNKINQYKAKGQQLELYENEVLLIILQRKDQ